MIRWPKKRESGCSEVHVSPGRTRVNSKALELESAKEILAEVFHARPREIEEMIQRRLEERRWPDERSEGLWPATF
jgi:hypothetical protein